MRLWSEYERMSQCIPNPCHNVARQSNAVKAEGSEALFFYTIRIAQGMKWSGPHALCSSTLWWEWRGEGRVEWGPCFVLLCIAEK